MRCGSVSIPVRVLGVLEPVEVNLVIVMVRFNPCKGFGGFGTEQEQLIVSKSFVSIPVRVLGVLELSINFVANLKLHVSIPVRVLGVLERPKSRRDGCIALVSIPVRVLGVLERRRSDRTSTPNRCFNPCKGFGGFGTSIAMLCCAIWLLFQSL